jgi:hypothetical protein
MNNDRLIKAKDLDAYLAHRDLKKISNKDERTAMPHSLHTALQSALRHSLQHTQITTPSKQYKIFGSSSFHQRHLSRFEQRNKVDAKSNMERSDDRIKLVIFNKLNNDDKTRHSHRCALSYSNTSNIGDQYTNFVSNIKMHEKSSTVIRRKYNKSNNIHSATYCSKKIKISNMIHKLLCKNTVHKAIVNNQSSIEQKSSYFFDVATFGPWVSK